MHASEYAWFPGVFPKGEMTLVNANRFSLERIRGITLEDFLLDHP